MREENGTLARKTEKTAYNLRRNGFEVLRAEKKETALKLLLKLVPKKATVGIGGSVTIQEIGAIEWLMRRGQRLLWHWKPNATPQEKYEIRRKALLSDVYLTSVNAVTQNGELVSVDAYGNRIAATVFGPKSVIIVTGKNKIVKDIPSAIRRIRNVVAPRNARRLSLNTPCVKKGRCVDCNSPQRICRVTAIISKRPTATPTTVIVVNETLGY